MNSQKHEVFINDLSSITSTQLEELNTNHITHATIADALRYIHTNVTSEINLDNLAASVFTSKFHLIRLFQRYIGITPKQYINQCRVRHAKQFIAEGGSGASIAADLCFSAQSHLCTVFKKSVGISVEEYRRNAIFIEQ